MAVTLSGLRTLVRRELADSAAANNRWSSTEIDAAINNAAVEFSIRSGVIVVRDTSITTVAGTATYDLPANCPGFASLHAVLYDDDVLDPTSPYGEAKLGHIPHDTDTADLDTPTHYYWETTTGTDDGGVEQIGLYPVPDDAQTVTLWYGAVAGAMTADGNYCDVPATWQFGVVYGACERLCRWRNKDKAADRFNLKYIGEINRGRAHVEAAVSAAVKRRDGKSNSKNGMW